MVNSLDSEITKPTFTLSIQDLYCAYIQNKPVLKIAHLKIPRGKLVFIIGRSGIGKSTFIETLGLMNDTIVSKPETSITFAPGFDDDIKMELKDSWKVSNSALAQLRRKYFSFIFQQTNLMLNFTAGENMMASRLIEKQSKKEAKEEVLRVMRQLSLEEELFNRNITQLSGGQRQRLAFIRAITANFSILFGDEPTGNLDRKTARELMGILKNNIQKDQKTGIIVSHDLPLAVEFADLIIPIEPQTDDSGDSYGVVYDKNIIRKKENQWLNNMGEVMDNPEDYLNDFL